ncbi:MAG TPA: hypothetical protein VMI54_16620 [Polyangiaceae bacterium]|nr:hypothetical protein [Polyangiaceae bacterium]
MSALDVETLRTAPDEAIDALDDELRATVGHEWLRRADVELTASSLTAKLVQGLLLDGATPEVIELATNAVGEEARHARVCHAVAERYLGRKLPYPRARRLEEARFGDAPPAVNRLLLFVLHSCVNETLATVCLREGLKLAASTVVKAATRELLSDDLNHARMGWAHLASPALDDTARAHVGAALPVLLRLGRDGWLDEPRSGIDVPEHGVLGNPSFPPLLRAAFDDLILPGFDHVGVDTRPAREWYYSP